MTAQLDMFASAAPTYPPHLDPEKAAYVFVDQVTIRDHVGEEDRGRLGNNREVYQVSVQDKGGEVLFAETFTTAQAASNRADDIRQQLYRNQQRNLW